MSTRKNNTVLFTCIDDYNHMLPTHSCEEDKSSFPIWSNIPYTNFSWLNVYVNFSVALSKLDKFVLGQALSINKTIQEGLIWIWNKTYEYVGNIQITPLLLHLNS